jgi:hypothetical protein
MGHQLAILKDEDTGEGTMETAKVTATFDDDSKRYHRFIIDEGQEIVGTIYVPKGEEVPEAVLVVLQTKNERKEREASD